MNVLIVDDHALFRVGLQGLLERRGLQVVGAAAEGEEGLRLAETLKPDVVLLDLRCLGSVLESSSIYSIGHARTFVCCIKCVVCMCKIN